MEIRLIPIGNSQGIRLPQAVLKQCEVKDTLNLNVINQTIVLSPPQPRRGWPEIFTKINKPSSQIPGFTRLTNQFDHTDWQW